MGEIHSHKEANVIARSGERVLHTHLIHLHLSSIVCTVLEIKRVENAFFHTMYIFSVILHAIDKHDTST